MALHWDDAPPPGAAPPGPASGSPPWMADATTELRLPERRKPPRKALFGDDRGGGLRASWHEDREVVVLSLWRSDVCVGTFQLPPGEAERLAQFLLSHADKPGGRRAS